MIKALSFTRAAQQLQGLSEPYQRAVEAYRQIVGAPREVTSRHVMETLGLEGTLSAMIGRYGVKNPLKAGPPPHGNDINPVWQEATASTLVVPVF